jgi:aspartate/methionine/tyrosine aminotransferase
MQIAHRMNRLGTETAFEVLVRAKALVSRGRHVTHLEIGEPDFDTPANIQAAAKRALDEGYTHYGPAPGLPELREAIAGYMGGRLGRDVSPEEVVVTPGGKPILFFTLLATVNEGDEVITPDPGFPIYESVVSFLGARPVPLHLHEDEDFRVNPEDLRRLITPRTRMIILNSPQNPTGGVLPQEDLRAIAEIALEHDLMVLSDEIYGRIVYDGFRHVSISSFPGMQERTVVLDGFSKTYAMTGWRLGFGVMPPELVKSVARLQINSNSCTASFTQIAGIEALRGPQDSVERMVAEFRRRRDVMVEGLKAIPGFTCHRPLGAFYVFPNIRGTGRASRFLADYLLQEANVSCLSGTAFGKHGEGYLRFSYANSVENIILAIQRMREAVAHL